MGFTPFSLVDDSSRSFIIIIITLEWNDNFMKDTSYTMYNSCRDVSLGRCDKGILFANNPKINPG
jgi:hypothetical protein